MSVPSLRKWLGIETIETSGAEKLAAAAGGGLALLALAGLSSLALPEGEAVPVIGSMGASAVLLFAVPHGQLSQPWPVIAGHALSAVIGVACAQMIDPPAPAAACAVGMAIGAMQLMKCVHPPGGATAFTAVAGGEAIRGMGFGFVLFPVLANALLMVLLAVLINNLFRWRRYPAALSRPPAPVPAPSSAARGEVTAALRSLDSFVDITEEELLYLVKKLSGGGAAAGGTRGTGKPPPRVPPSRRKALQAARRGRKER